MAGNYIAATPTRAAAREYVEKTELAWGDTGEVLKQHLMHIEDGEAEVWRIQTVTNIWDVWMERAGDGFRVYGEC